MIKFLCYKISQFIHFIEYIIKFMFKDLYLYIKNKEYAKFKEFGIEVYCGLFGTGKTSSMVYRAYRLQKRYKDVEILTNIKLNKKYFKCKITPLTNYQQIVDIRKNTIILLDEGSTIFNSRSWKKQIPNALLGSMFQCRKEYYVLFLVTAQRFEHLDKLFRDITLKVHQCNMFFRLSFYQTYDAIDFENTPIGVPLPMIGYFVYVQSNKIRDMYNTDEIVIKGDFLSDDEILSNRGVTVKPETDLTTVKLKKMLK